MKLVFGICFILLLGLILNSHAYDIEKEFEKREEMDAPPVLIIDLDDDRASPSSFLNSQDRVRQGTKKKRDERTGGIAHIDYNLITKGDRFVSLEHHIDSVDVICYQEGIYVKFKGSYNISVGDVVVSANVKDCSDWKKARDENYHHNTPLYRRVARVEKVREDLLHIVTGKDLSLSEMVEFLNFRLNTLVYDQQEETSKKRLSLDLAVLGFNYDNQNDKANITYENPILLGNSTQIGTFYCLECYAYLKAVLDVQLSYSFWTDTLSFSGSLTGSAKATVNFLVALSYSNKTTLFNRTFAEDKKFFSTVIYIYGFPINVDLYGSFRVESTLETQLYGNFSFSASSTASCSLGLTYNDRMSPYYQITYPVNNVSGIQVNNFSFSSEVVARTVISFRISILSGINIKLNFIPYIGAILSTKACENHPIGYNTYFGTGFSKFF